MLTILRYTNIYREKNIYKYSFQAARIDNFLKKVITIKVRDLEAFS